MYVDVIGMINQMNDKELVEWINSLSPTDLERIFNTVPTTVMRNIFRRMYGTSDIVKFKDQIDDILSNLDDIAKDMPDRMFQNILHEMYYETEDSKEIFDGLWKIAGTLLIESN